MCMHANAGSLSSEARTLLLQVLVKQGQLHPVILESPLPDVLSFMV